MVKHFDGDKGEDVWRLVTVFYKQSSTQRDLLLIVNDAKEKALRVGFTIGM